MAPLKNLLRCALILVSITAHVVAKPTKYSRNIEYQISIEQTISRKSLSNTDFGKCIVELDPKTPSKITLNTNEIPGMTPSIGYYIQGFSDKSCKDDKAVTKVPINGESNVILNPRKPIRSFFVKANSKSKVNFIYHGQEHRTFIAVKPNKCQNLHDKENDSYEYPVGLEILDHSGETATKDSFLKIFSEEGCAAKSIISHPQSGSKIVRSGDNLPDFTRPKGSKSVQSFFIMYEKT